jgi:hypothetical protein
LGGGDKISDSIILYLYQGWTLFGIQISTIATIATFLTAIIAAVAVYLTLRQQNINLSVIREERYHKEMDLLIKKLYNNRDEYEQFEPHHVDPNNTEEEKQALEFWKEIRENKYLAPKELRDIIDQYLKLVNEHEKNILKSRTTLSDILKKRCENLETFKEDILKMRILNPIDGCIKDKLCPMIGERGLVRPMPIDDRLRRIYMKTWQDQEGILQTLEINPQEELRGPAYRYFDAITKPETGPTSLIYLRMDLSRAAESRYKELEEKIESIKSNLENGRVWQPWRRG